MSESSRPRRIALLAAAIATAATLFIAPAAGAETRVVPDDRRDFWHDTRSEGDDPYPGNPDWGNPDIRRTAYRYFHDRVSVRITMARLVRGDGGYWEVDIRLRTNEGLQRRATWFKPHDGPTSTEWSGAGACAVDGRIDFAEDVFIVEVPRRCLSNPARVSFKSATRWWPTSDDYPYLDVSGSPGYRLSQWSAPVSRG